jgi:protein gp37
MTTKIQWTDTTANPLKERAEKALNRRSSNGGNYCVPISPGCANCYASALNAKGTRFGGNGRKFGVRKEGHPEMWLNLPMLRKWERIRKPRKIFVGSMTDIFGEWVPDWMIYCMLDAMANSKATFQLLTKRPERAFQVMKDWTSLYDHNQPPPNIWLGTSVEDQKRLDERLICLIRTPAAVRFLSVEPLLGPTNLFDVDGPTSVAMNGDDPRNLLYPADMIDWVIIGGESGPNARPLELAWVEDILYQCKAANVPAFVKQLGTHWAKVTLSADRKGGDPAEWPAELRVRMFPGEVWK